MKRCFKKARFLFVLIVVAKRSLWTSLSLNIIPAKSEDFAEPETSPSASKAGQLQQKFVVWLLSEVFGLRFH
jgi:hypothetical protein